MLTSTDAYGKILRVGDRVHKLIDKREVKKHEPNGRTLAPQGTQIVKTTGLKNNGVLLRRGVFDGADLVKE